MRQKICVGLLILLVAVNAKAADAGVISRIENKLENVELAKQGILSTKGVWVSCFEYEQIGLSGKAESTFRANADKIFYNIKASGCNTVYFHVRSFDDAIYPSSVVKWSSYLLGGGGAPKYDPLKILVESAHKHGLAFHAWMNPYRVTFSTTLNPAKEKTKNRIVDQVQEILDNYPVDGIHFDDYFYTGEKKYKNVSTKERMKNVNDMVQRVHKTVKDEGKIFGISPAGNIEYCEKIGADINTWMSEDGYVDYIVPQIYWSDEYIMNGKKRKLFSERLAQWTALNARGVPMYIGLGAYRAGAKMKDDIGWKKSNTNLSRQISKLRENKIEGYVLFCYVDLYRTGAQKEMKNLLANIAEAAFDRAKIVSRTGKTIQVKASIWPARLKEKIQYRSSNKKVASCSSSGLVTTKKVGDARIYPYYRGKKMKSFLLLEVRDD